MDEKTFVTTREAARLLNVSLRTIQLWTESGVLSAWKTAGGHRRISAKSVKKIREDQLLKTAAPDGDSITTVVIVEDDPLYRELYKLKIATWRLFTNIVVAKDGFEGLLTIGKVNPQLVITDLGMPGMDGFQMIRSLREASVNLDIIVITGLSDQEIESKGGLPDDVTVLKKPDPLQQLEALLHARSETITADA